EDSNLRHPAPKKCNFAFRGQGTASNRSCAIACPTSAMFSLITNIPRGTTATSGPTRSLRMRTKHSPRPAGRTITLVAKRLREHLFGVGNTIDPADGYRAF